MRHRMSGRKLGRNASHRKAMFRNMSVSLIRSVDDEFGGTGRIVTTLAKAKELRGVVERLVTLAKRSLEADAAAAELGTQAEKGSDAWLEWRKSERWQQWSMARSVGVTLRRRAFAEVRDRTAVDLLFRELGPRYQERPGGYLRVIKLATRRLGDAGKQAIVEFVTDSPKAVIVEEDAGG
jgi:large subunit ribosomal protein L17